MGTLLSQLEEFSMSRVCVCVCVCVCARIIPIIFLICIMLH